MSDDDAPLAGLRVVEVALGTSVVGAGMAASIPGALLRDLGAEVGHVRSARRSTLDAGVEFSRVWDRGKEVVEANDEGAADVVSSLVGDADVLFLCGPEELIERHGLGYHALANVHPGLVQVRVRPSVNALGSLPDFDLLVAARAGVMTQIRHHTAGRAAFPDFPVGQLGAALSAAVGALARLYERETTGVGGWAETSLYDGIQAMLPMILGRVEHHSPSTTLLWKNQGPTETLAYRCADGEYLQLWFGAKGAYEAFLEAMGDEPSAQGYNADLVGGAMAERSARWAATLATKERAAWLRDFAGLAFRCEPVLRPGEALLDGHVREVGLAVEHDGATMVGPVVRVTRTVDGAPVRDDDSSALLTGVHVLDLSAYLAGPIGALVLADLGADVVKVEPTTGDVHRNMEPMYAAGQRGKRTVALDLKSPDAPAALERLFGWADVVHHNSRLGLAEKLGYDERSARAANPDLVYSFASGFGERGPRAPLPANDHLMQALSGVEAAQGGDGQPPTFLVWGAIDVTGGWLSAIGMLAGLYARRRTGGGQSVASSLLGAALLVKSGAFVDGASGSVVRGPVLDADQTGYGAAYRIYRCADGGWLALAIPDADAWSRLRRVVGVDALPTDPPPLHTDGGDPQPAEKLLEHAFATKRTDEWLTLLRDAGVPVERVVEVDRSGFTSALVDDPVNQQLGRVIHYEWGERGRVDQPTFPPRLGPTPKPGAPARIATLGEHTADLLGPEPPLSRS